MSRVGKAPITIPAGVEVKVENNVVSVKGKLGELHQEFDPMIEVKLEDNVLTVHRPNDNKDMRSKHGLYRALFANMVKGVSEGFERKLELVGVGYRAAVTGQLLELSLGYSHSITFQLPKEVKVDALSEKGKNPIVTLQSFDKQLLGMVSSKIRSLRKPEPYKGKGVRYVGEQIRRKAGKTAGK